MLIHNPDGSREYLCDFCHAKWTMAKDRRFFTGYFNACICTVCADAALAAAATAGHSA